MKQITVFLGLSSMMLGLGLPSFADSYRIRLTPDTEELRQETIEALSPKKLLFVTAEESYDFKVNLSKRKLVWEDQRLHQYVERSLSDGSNQTIQKEVRACLRTGEESAVQVLKDNLIPYLDFPKPGIQFQAMTQILRHPLLFKSVIELAARKFENHVIDAVFGVDSRGYLLGAPLALRLNAAFVMVTKKGKSPGQVIRASYQKEYGEDELEMTVQDSFHGSNVLIVDDLLATGGTLAAAESLARKIGASVVGSFCLTELTLLKGRDILLSPFRSLIQIQ